MKIFNIGYNLSFRLTKPFIPFFFCTKQQPNTNLEMIMERMRKSVDRTRELEKQLIDQSLGESSLHVNADKARMEINSMATIVSKYEELAAVLKVEFRFII